MLVSRSLRCRPSLCFTAATRGWSRPSAVITHPAHFLPIQSIWYDSFVLFFSRVFYPLTFYRTVFFYFTIIVCSPAEPAAMNFADASSYHERRRGRVFVDDPLSSLEQEILLFRHNNIQKFQQGKTCFAAPQFFCFVTCFSVLFVTFWKFIWVFTHTCILLPSTHRAVDRMDG